jgi:outer membrane receptor protein involved in Fe transport
MKSTLHKHAALLALLTISACQTALAEAPKSTEDLLGMSMEQLLDVKVTTVTKNPVSVSKAPAIVDVITRDDLRRFGYRTLAEALRRIVGFNTYNTQYQFSFVRGFAIPGDFNTRILLLIDGHRTNDGNYNQAMIGDELPADLENVERIEVSKGPGSAVWGTNAMLAVVNIITRHGAQVGGAETVGTVGSNGKTKIFEAIGAKDEGGLEYNFTGSYLDEGGYNHIHFPGRDLPDGELISDGSDGQFAFHGGANIDFNDLHLQVFHSVRKTQLPYGFFGVDFNDGGNAYNDNSTRVDLNVDRVVDSTDNKRVFARFFYDRWGFDGDYIYSDADGNRTINHDNADASSIGLEFRYSQDVNKWLSVLVGAEFQDMNELLNYNRSPQSPVAISAIEPFELQTYYSELHFRVAEPLEIIGGIRGDIYSTQDNAWTPRAAIVYTPFSTSTARLSYGEGFRASDNSERNYADNISAMANRSLKPERVRTVEASWQERLNESIQATLSVFHYRFTDLISAGQTADGLFQYNNVGAATISKGAELSAIARLTDGLTGYGGTTLLNTESDGERLAASPRFMANGGVSAPFFDARLFVSPEVRYVGALKPLKTDLPDTPGYFAANLNLLTKPTKSGWELSAGIYNMFDKKYYLTSGPQLPYDGITQPGRTYQVQARVKF